MSNSFNNHSNRHQEAYNQYWNERAEPSDMPPANYGDGLTPISIGDAVKKAAFMKRLKPFSERW